MASAKSKKIEEKKLKLNESVFVAFSDRIENLKKLIYNLIIGAEGKNQKTGYGKDWKRIFIDLDQKLNILESTRNGISERDRKFLEDIEKQVEKQADEYLGAVIQTSSRISNEIEQNPDLEKYYSDVLEIFNKALDTLTRSKSQYISVLKDVKEEIGEKEIELVKYIFPLKSGDSDSNKRFSGSGLISKIQDALSDGIPSAAAALRNSGEKGIYGPKTEAVVKALQKNVGNKNVDGKLDKSLLDSILISDFISDKNKKIIIEAIKSIKKPLNEGFVFGSVSENKIVIDKESFAKDLDSFAKAENESSGSKMITDEEKASLNIENLAKRLRKEYGVRVESDDFKREDGNFKISYSAPFINAWYTAVEEIGGDKNYQYFYWDGGVYAIDSERTSLKNPSNWKSWANIRQINDLSDDDCVDFFSNYLEEWKTFGMIKPEYRSSALKSLYKKNADLELDFPGVYEMVSPVISESEIPFIPYDILTKKIAKAVNEIAQIGEDNPDLGASDMVVLNNLLCMVANAISYDGDRFISCIRWIYDNSLSPRSAKRISSDTITVSGSPEKRGHMLFFEGSTIKVRSTSDISLSEESRLDQYKEIDDHLEGWKPLSRLSKNSSSPIKASLGNNVYFIGSRVYPSVKVHLKRINSMDFSQVPQEDNSKCYQVKTDN
jgi:peptidoglycan hydrolase-like protein with peptidoglycan-binding domain